MDTKQGSQQEAEVHDIKEKKEVKLKKADYFRMLAKHVNGQKTALQKGKLPPFPNKYHLELTEDKQLRLLIQKADRTVEPCSEDYFKSDVLTFIGEHLFWHEYFSGFVERSAHDFYLTWKMITPPIRDIPTIGLKSYEGLCFNRTDFNFHYNFTPEHYNTLDKLIGRNYNYQAVKYFLGSLFDPEADIQQVLVLYGEGMNGKSTLLNFLCKCMNGAVASSMAPDKFSMKNFTAQFVGKRLGIFPDAENLEFLQSQQFKMMTGGDLVAIDQKYERVYNRRLNCKFIISSNHKPVLKGQKSDSRRLIYYEMPEVADPDPKFLDRLYDQREGIFCHLLDMYYENVGSNSQIPVEADQLKNVLDENSIDEQTFFQEYFRIDEDGKTSTSTINNCIYHRFGPTWSGKEDFRKSFDLWVRREILNDDTAKIGGMADGTVPIKRKGDVFRGYKGFEVTSGYGTLACKLSTKETASNNDKRKLQQLRNEICSLERQLGYQVTKFKEID